MRARAIAELAGKPQSLSRTDRLGVKTIGSLECQSSRSAVDLMTESTFWITLWSQNTRSRLTLSAPYPNSRSFTNASYDKGLYVPSELPTFLTACLQVRCGEIQRSLNWGGVASLTLAAKDIRYQKSRIKLYRRRGVFPRQRAGNGVRVYLSVWPSVLRRNEFAAATVISKTHSPRLKSDDF